MTQLSSDRITRPTRPTRRLAGFAAAAITALAAAAGALAQPVVAALPATPATPAARYDVARDAYEIGHYAAAFAVFAELADEGHCEAGRIAQQMLRYGRALYLTEFAVVPGRLARWRALPGCPVALAAR